MAVHGRVAAAVGLTSLVGLLAGLAGLLASPAAAVLSYPADRDVERARQAEGAALSEVARAEERLAAATVRLDELIVAAARAAEAHNGAQYALAEAEAAEVAAAEHAGQAAAAADLARDELGRVAAATYRTGGQFALLSAVLQVDRADQFVDGTATIRAATRSQGTIRDRAVTAAAEAEDAAEQSRRARMQRKEAARTAELVAQEAAASVAHLEAEIAAAEQARDRAVTELADARETTVVLEEKRQAGLVAAEAVDRERAERDSTTAEHGDERLAAASTPVPESPPAASGTAAPSPEPTRTPPADTTSPPPSTPAPPVPEPPPAATRAEPVLAYARAQLGKPYEWGAEGPDSFDCSGLTMRAWQQAGVQLPHWSVAQASLITRISYAELALGDLIFWSDNGRASGTYHVGLYIGGGKMIHAPRPGKVVEIQNVFYWRTPSFYGRV